MSEDGKLLPFRRPEPGRGATPADGGRDEGTARASHVSEARPRVPDPYASLAELAAQGDREALGQLLRVLAPKVLGAARSVLGREHPDLEDLVQESLLAVARALPAFEARSTVVHFAYRITARTCLAGRKRQRDRARREEPISSPDRVIPDESARPEDQLLAERRRDATRALLDALPDTQAEALAMRLCLGMALTEIAEATDTPVNTVRSRLRLARQAMLRRIEADAALREILEVPT